MTTTSRKIQGPWKQGLYQQSATATEIVGTVREDQFGRMFRYAKAGGTALAPGKQTTMPATDADWLDNAVATAGAIGATQVTMTIVDVDSGTLDKDYFRGGQLQVNDGTGEGTLYPIIHSDAIIDGQTSFTVTLSEPLEKAIVATTTQVTPVPSPWMATVLCATETYYPTGVPLIDVTAEYYYWSQTKGLGVYWAHDDVAAIGTQLVLSDADGELEPMIDADATSATDFTRKIVATAVARITAVDTEYCPCIYCID